jgi:hypothetical protein
VSIIESGSSFGRVLPALATHLYESLNMYSNKSISENIPVRQIKTLTLLTAKNTGFL